MTVKDSPLRTDYPYVIAEEETQCITSKTYRVPVPAGQTRYIKIVTNDSLSPLNQEYSITSQADIQIFLDSFQNEDDSLNTVFENIYLFVGLNNTNYFWNKGITRYGQDDGSGNAIEC